MKQIVIISVLMLCSLNCSSQQFDSIYFSKIAKEYFARYLKCRKYSDINNPVSISDTANFILFLPIVCLNEARDTVFGGYQSISPYIEKKFSPHNMRIFIVDRNRVYTFSIIKGIYERYYQIGLSDPVDSLPEMFFFSISKKNPNIAKNYDAFPYDENILYIQLKNYLEANPNVVLFTIKSLPGVWGYKNDHLIKLMFYANIVEEMDGEEYYRDYLFPLSPMGIKRILEGNSFIPIITI